MPDGNNYLDRLLKNKLKRNDANKTTENESEDFRRKNISKFKNNSRIASKRSNQPSEKSGKEPPSELRNVIRNARFDAMSRQSKNNAFSPPITLNHEPTNIQLFTSSEEKLEGV